VSVEEEVHSIAVAVVGRTLASVGEEEVHSTAVVAENTLAAAGHMAVVYTALRALGKDMNHPHTQKAAVASV